MKKILASVVLALVSFTSFAQMPQISNTKVTLPNTTPVQSNYDFDFQQKPRLSKKGSTKISAWYDYGDALTSWYIGIQLFAPYMAPDTGYISPQWSNGQITGWDPAAWNSVGIGFDPRDPLYDYDNNPDTEAADAPYTIDSLVIPYFYYKPQANVIDTLVVQIYKGTGQKNSSAEAWSTTINSQTVPMVTTTYNISTGLGSNAVQTIKVPLTLADTSTVGLGLLEVALNKPLRVVRGEIMAATFTYMPTNMQKGDTFAGQYNNTSNYHNSFRFLMYADPDQNTNISYNNGLLVQYQQRHSSTWLQSSNESARYLTGIAFNSYFYPNIYFHLYMDHPDGLTASAKSSSEIALAWNDNADNETGYIIQRSLDSINWTTVDTISVNATSFTNTNLNGSTKYYFRVTAYLGNGEITQWSNLANATTFQAIVPNDPTNLQATASSIDVDLSWTDNANNEDGTYIYRSTDNVSFVKIDSVGANTTAYTDLNVSVGNSYWYYVEAYNNDGISNNSNTVKVTIPIPVPAKPNNLVASLAGSDVQLDWADNATDEDGFYIYRSTDNSTFMKFDSVDADVTTYTDAMVSAGNQYWYYIKAYNTYGESGKSNTATIGISLVVPLAPDNLVVTLILFSESVQLDWDDNSTVEDGFYIYRSTDSINFSKLDSVGTDVSTYTDADISSGNRYWYYVIAYNTDGQSAKSNTATLLVTFLPDAPDNLAGVLAGNDAQLDWDDMSSDEDGFYIYRSTDNINFNKADSVSAGIDTYTDNTTVTGNAYWYYVTAYNTAGESGPTNTVKVDIPVGIAVHDRHIESSIYPNPAYDVINMEFILNRNVYVTIMIRDITGRELLSRAANMPAGKQKVTFDLSGLKAGVYLATLSAEGASKTVKLVVSK